jgi:hypothetical protein
MGKELKPFLITATDMWTAYLGCGPTSEER